MARGTQAVPMELTPTQAAALKAWADASAKADAAKAVIAAEQTARKAAFAALGLTDSEGTQAVQFPDGWGLKYKTPYKREIDPAVVGSLRAPLKALHVSLDRLIEWKPALVTKEYRELTEEARAIFDQCITTTIGLPTLEIVAPKVKP